jgi:hypothetical protein
LSLPLVHGCSVGAELEHLELRGAGLGDPQLVRRSHVAHVVRVRSDGYAGDDRRRARIDDEQLPARAIGDVHLASTRVGGRRGHRSNSATTRIPGRT